MIADKNIEMSDRISTSTEPNDGEPLNEDNKFVVNKVRIKVRFLIFGSLFLFLLMLLSVHAISSNNKGAIRINSSDDIPIYMSGMKLLEFFENNIQNIDLINKKESLNGRIMHNSYYENFRFLLTALSQKTSLTRSEILTRDVSPLNYVHSHNDYWRTLPLYDALLHGVNSVEADIWLIKNEKEKKDHLLAVGHNQRHLRPEEKNLQSLYIKPLLEILEEINIAPDSENLEGVFFNEPEMPLILYIDFKDHSPDNMAAYEELLKQLQPLKRYLTTKSDFEKKKYKPLIIELTGDYPILTKYDDTIFLDSSIIKVYKNEVAFKSPIISESFNNLIKFCNGHENDGRIALKLLSKKAVTLSDEEIICMSEIINKAHEKNYKVRIWGVPQFPIYNRDGLWKQQMDVLEVDYLNVDDLDAVVKL